MRTVQDILDRWPSAAELARRLGLDPIVVQRWRSRGRIPGEYDVALVERALLDGFVLSYEDLAQARANSNIDHDGRGNYSLQAGVKSACEESRGKPRKCGEQNTHGEDAA